ncbi:UDP-glucosyltransferase 2-like [Sitodiplosis mosellana]|uniref:UDP-glucosyltransferase 2-like n=1 Tax=Sitodiplosis mosellana TaxID=263140 RepID=UPI002444EFE2|nr:UDP-glucosyltransferase 2-like [Sitodiplosis mosellana]
METLNTIYPKENEEKLADNVQEVLDSALQGVIYVRIGTHLPIETQDKLIETFRDMNQKCIWDGILPSDSNFIICNNSPSRLILSHKNTSLLITEDDTVAIKQALHYGIPMLIIPFQNNELHSIVKYTALESIFTIRADEINQKTLKQKLTNILNNKNLKSHAKEIAGLLHHNSMNLSKDLALAKEGVRHYTQTSRQLSPTYLHLDALGALFFVIFVIVKLSLKFCRIYNNFEWKTNASPKKTK